MQQHNKLGEAFHFGDAANTYLIINTAEEGLEQGYEFLMNGGRQTWVYMSFPRLCEYETRRSRSCHEQPHSQERDLSGYG